MFDFPRKKFNVIAADPPWDFATRSAKGDDRSARQHYATMGLDAIKSLPVAGLADRDCVLALWVTDTHHEQAMDLIKAWGFKFKTVGFYWVKLTRSGKTDHFGLGFWTRANPESVMIATRGSPEIGVDLCYLATKGHPKRADKSVRRLIVSRVREHSRKPEEFYERVEALVEGPRIELFARQERPGWTAWGNETSRFNRADTSDIL